MGINGEGIGYISRKPVFCQGVLPGETAEIRITEKKEKYCRAEVIEITEPAKMRRRPVCRHQNECGSCPLMVMDYPWQLKYKKELLEEALYKYGNVKRHFVRDVKASPDLFGWRNQCKFPVQESGGELTSGMYVRDTNHYRPIERCPVQDDTLEEVRHEVFRILNKHSYRAWNGKNGLRQIVLRCIDNKVQCTLITGKEKIKDNLIRDLMKIREMQGLFQSVNTEKNTVNVFGQRPVKLAGEDTLPVTVFGIRLELSPESFFQMNLKQAELLYQTAVSKIDPCDVLVEAYAGIGAMSLMASQKAKTVIGIESVKDAVENAKQSAERNGITNAEFICADAADGLYMAARTRHVNTLLVDPPRSGMDQKMIEAVLKVMPDKIIYVSCNPATLAKNLKDLKHDYHVVTVIPFDMFPHTPHIESVTVLEKG